MRRLTFLVLIVAALYSGYWFIGSRTVVQSSEAAVAQAREAGWTVDFEDLKTIGFPSRFDTTMTDLRLISPDGRLGWEAPFIQAFALSYQPNKVIVAFPPTHEVTFDNQRLALKTADFRASAGIKANTNMSFDATTAEAGRVDVRSSDGWTVSAQSLLAAVRSAPDAPTRQDVFLDVSDIVLSQDLTRQFDPKNLLSDRISTLVADGTFALDRPLDRFAFETTLPPPRLTQANLRRFDMVWGPMALSLDGDLTFDQTGVPTGELTIRTTTWREMIEVFMTAGMIDKRAEVPVTLLLNGMAGNDGTLSADIRFQGGQMLLGRLPIGPAPKIVLFPPK